MSDDPDRSEAEQAGMASTDEATADQMRRVLAAEPDPPLPPDVAARVTAALRAEAARRTDEESTRVVPLRRRRSRRWVLPAAVAASAVAVVGIGSQVLTTTSGGSADSSSSLAESQAPSGAAAGSPGSAGSGAARADRGGKDGSKTQLGKDQGPRARHESSDTAKGALPTLGPDAPRLQEDRLTADLRTEVTDTGLIPRPARWLPLDQDTCRRLSPPASTGVLLDGEPAYLVVDDSTPARRYLVLRCRDGHAMQVTSTPAE